MYDFFEQLDRIENGKQFIEDQEILYEKCKKMQNVKKMAWWFKGEIERDILEQLFIISNEIKRLKIAERITNIEKEKIRLKAHKAAIVNPKAYYIELAFKYVDIYPSKFEFAQEAQEEVLKKYYDRFKLEVRKLLTKSL